MATYLRNHFTFCMLTDEGQQNSDAGQRTNAENEKIEKEQRREENDDTNDGDAKKKRKRKDNRTSKDRRKKQR